MVRINLFIFLSWWGLEVNQIREKIEDAIEIHPTVSYQGYLPRNGKTLAK